MGINFNQYGTILSYDEDINICLNNKVIHMLKSVISTNNIQSMYPFFLNSLDHKEIELYEKLFNQTIANDVDFIASGWTYTVKIESDKSGKLVLVIYKDGVINGSERFIIEDLINIQHKEIVPTFTPMKVQRKCINVGVLEINNYVNISKMVYVGTTPPVEKFLQISTSSSDNKINILTILDKTIKNGRYSILKITPLNCKIYIDGLSIFAIKNNPTDPRFNILIYYTTTNTTLTLTNKIEHNNLPLHGDVINSVCRITSPSITKGLDYYISIAELN